MEAVELKRLEEIGLTTGEVKVYLALLKLGGAKTGPLAARAGVSSSKVYKILDRLQEKGLVGHVLKAGVKHFRAMEPKRIVDYIEERQAQLDVKKALVMQMLPGLEKERMPLEAAEGTVYSGFKAVTNFFRGILDELGPGETYYVIGAYYPVGQTRMKRFFHKHHQRRALKKIRVKMLANHDIKGRMVETTALDSEIRFLPQYLITKMEIVFYRNKTFIAIFAEEPIGFLIESEEVTKSFRAYFNAFWKIAKPE